MKKIYYYLFVFTLIFSTSVSLISCDGLGLFGSGDSEEDINTPNDSIPGIDGPSYPNDSIPGIDGPSYPNDSIPSYDPEKVYQDKEDFQRIALDFMDKFQTNDFVDVMELAEYTFKEASEYKMDGAQKWLDDCLEDLGKEIESENAWETYETIYRLSSFKGRFAVENDSLVRYDADNLSITVNDQNGNPCEVVVTTSGNTKRVHLFNSISESATADVVDENGNYIPGESKIESEEIIWIEVPEHITMSLRQNGNLIAEAVINTDLSSMKGEDINLAKDRYNVNTKLYFNNYTINVEKIYYENEKESEVAFNIKDGGTTLLSGKLCFTPEMVMSGDEFCDINDEDSNIKNTFLSVKILDQLEITGKCKDVKTLYNILDGDEDDTTDSKVNRHLDVNLYFYGVEESVAKIEFESIEDGYYNGDNYEIDYDLLPVIVFNDGSRNSIEDYFNENDFKVTIDAFNNLLNSFEDMIDGYDF